MLLMKYFYVEGQGRKIWAELEEMLSVGAAAAMAWHVASTDGRLLLLTLEVNVLERISKASHKSSMSKWHSVIGALCVLVAIKYLSRLFDAIMHHSLAF